MEKKPVGRPKKNTIAKMIRMPAELVKQIDAKAKKEGMSFTSYVVHVLTKSL